MQECEVISGACDHLCYCVHTVLAVHFEVTGRVLRAVLVSFLCISESYYIKLRAVVELY